jgi:hypothetical protein
LLHLLQPFAALVFRFVGNLIHQVIPEAAGASGTSNAAIAEQRHPDRTKIHRHCCVSLLARPRTNAPGFSISRRTASRARSLALNPLSRASSLSARRRSADNRNSNRASFSISESCRKFYGAATHRHFCMDKFGAAAAWTFQVEKCP